MFYELLIVWVRRLKVDSNLVLIRFFWMNLPFFPVVFAVIKAVLLSNEPKFLAFFEEIYFSV